MSYWDDWHNNNLQSNQIASATVTGGAETIDITDDVCPDNCNLQIGSDDILLSINQPTLTIEIENYKSKYYGVEFKGKTLNVSVSANTYTFTFNGFKIINAKETDNHILLEGILCDLTRWSKPSWSSVTDGSSDGTTIQTVYDKAKNITGIPVDNMPTYGTKTLRVPNNSSLNTTFRTDKYNSINNMAEFWIQLAQLFGFTRIYNSNGTTRLKVVNLARGTLEHQINDYRDGGSYDETEITGIITLQNDVDSSNIDVSNISKLYVSGKVNAEDFYNLSLRADGGNLEDILENYINGTPIDVSDCTYVQLFYESNTLQSCTLTYGLLPTYYRTGDSVDGNAAVSHDGGSFDIPYKVISDNVINNLTIDQEYIKLAMSKVVLPTPVYREEESSTVLEGFTEEEIVRKYGADKSEDYTNNIFVTLAGCLVSNYIDFQFYFNYYEVGGMIFIPFNVTVANNLDFDIGDIVAIAHSDTPTRFSYIENINTDLFGNTVLSNNNNMGDV